MTTPSTPRKAGPFTGNGSQTAWPFAFKVYAASDIAVTVVDTLNAETTLTLGADYSVTLNSNQDTSPGGTVTYLLAQSSKLVITSALPYTQEYDIPGGGNFNPVALENQLDRTVMQVQQLVEQVGRSLKQPVTGGDALLGGELVRSLTRVGYSATGDGATTVFTLTFSTSSVLLFDLFLGGVHQVPNVDYTYTGSTLTFGEAPAAGVSVYVRAVLSLTEPPDSDHAEFDVP